MWSNSLIRDGAIKSFKILAQMIKYFIYSLLRRLPGKPGRRFHRKFMRRDRKIGFEKAVRRSGGMTCIDLGANVGEYTRKLASGTKQVIAFEPDPWSLAALHANTADLDNVRIENAAAGTSERMVLLYRHAQFEEDPTFYSVSSSVIASKRNVSEEKAVEVRQINFISYLENLDEDIGILKVDIEGAEVELLEALFDRPDIVRRVHHIFAETHESRIPGHESRVNALHQIRAHRIKKSHINLYWY